jgi:hypothetical protein
MKKAIGEIISKTNRRFEQANLPARYQITTHGKRGAQRYGLIIAPERIKL